MQKLKRHSLIPGWGGSPGWENGNPLQYSCLENLMDRGPWRATVHGVTNSRTRLKQLSMHMPSCRNWGSERWVVEGTVKRGGGHVCTCDWFMLIYGRKEIKKDGAKLCLTLSIPWIGARQAPLSMGFSRQEYWSGLPFLSPGDLPDPGIEPRSPTLQADALPTELCGKHIWQKPSQYCKVTILQLKIKF